MKHNLKATLIVFLSFLTLSAFAQEKKDITLESIFKQGAFGSRSVYGVNWMNDGRYYSSLKSDRNSSFVVKFDIVKNAAIDTLVDTRQLRTIDNEFPRFSGYSFNADETQALLTTSFERIYRRSSKAVYYLYNIERNTLRVLADGKKVSYATFSPDGKKVAYTRDNNLYVANLANLNETAITTDGEWNKIINGSADWVYEEEFSMAKAFKWSPDSKRIAFLRFDESGVKEYNMQIWGNLYPKDYKFKYPKAGEDNSLIEVKVYDTSNGQTVSMDIGQETDIYVPRIYWTSKAGQLSILRLNRLQNRMDILHGNTASGATVTALTETAKTYVDLDYNDNLTYLKNDKGIIRTSEQDGYKHIYWHSADGQQTRQITKGDWEVTELVGVNQKSKKIYFISTETSPLQRELYVIGMNGRGKKKLSKLEGTNRVNMSKDHAYYINYYSSLTTPNTVTLHRSSGKQLSVLEENKATLERLEGYKIGEKKFFDFTTEENISLNGYMVYPADFDKNKKYPVLMYVYGGPGSQNVKNSFPSSRDRWFNMLANKGYIVACVDNRGTGFRGRDFKHVTYKNLGKYESQDQISAAKYLGSLPYVDKGRIGIWGWSYGGYMSSLCLFTGNDVFKAAIAVAPVTNWRFYDSIYTERYMQRPQDNPTGYDAFSPVFHASKLKGNFLLVHGTGDDNVHFQNAVELVNELVKTDKQFESFYYPNRNHGIYGGNTTMHLYRMLTNFVMNKL
ncbi:peptidase S9 [Fulvitalea axinellae]|uniref:Peptidase S9 n=1 Tax=Fulvitalea axinellae TaxID=1182444 RepID=A0AAU9CLF6_9BACT|nr:peptidase S9 [Fulvitalea axinellae]